MNRTGYSPRIHIYSGSRPRVAWVFMGGYSGDPRCASLLDPQGEVVHRDSMFWPFRDDIIIMIEHPAFEIRDWRVFHAAVYRRICAYVSPGFPVILVGLQRGGQVLTDFLRWHDYDRPIVKRRLDLHGVLLSTPATGYQVRPRVRWLARLAASYQMGPGAQGWIGSRLDPMHLPKAVRQGLVREGRGEMAKAIGAGRRHSSGASVNLFALARHPGWQELTAATLDRTMMVVNLPPRLDHIINVAASVEEFGRVFGGRAMAIDLAEFAVTHRLPLPTGHGLVEVDGRLYAAVLSQMYARVCPCT